MSKRPGLFRTRTEAAFWFAMAIGIVILMLIILFCIVRLLWT